MAFYFSKRKLRPAEEGESGELNIIPYLDILMNLNLFMLASITGLAAMGILNVNAPNYGAAAGGPSDQENQNTLLLTVAIATNGFYVAAQGGVLGNQPESAAVPGQGEPTIPKKPDGTYDFAGLTAKLVQIKQTFPTQSKVVIAGQQDVVYETLVATMDACRETSDRKLLFPDVTLGAF